MRLPVFFISLFFILLGINFSSFAGVEFHSSNASSHLYFNKAQCTASEISSGNWIINNNSSSQEEDKILVCEDVEDEDANDPSPRKYSSVAGFYSILFDQPGLNFHYSNAGEVPFFRIPARRYILQRNLRI